MKKIVWSLIIITGMFSSVHAAENFVMKRRLMAAKTVAATAAIVDACITLKQVQYERVSLGGANDFQDSDFVGLEGGQFLQHLSSYTIGVMLDTVAPDFIDLYEDVSINRDTMNKIRH